MHRTNSSKIFFIGAILVVVCGMFPDFSYAASSANSNIIAEIVNEFQGQAQKIIAVAGDAARKLFYWCAVLEIAWLGVNAALGQADIGDTIKKFCIVLVVCGFFLACINNYYEWSSKIIHGLEDLAGGAAKIQQSSDLGFKKGLQFCTDMWTKIKGLDFLDSAGVILLWIFTLLIVIVIFCLITARVIVYKCESYIAMAASVLLLGFGGSSVMREYATAALKFILAVGVKLFTMQLIIGIGYSFIEKLSSGEPDIAHALVTLGTVIVLYVLVATLPSTVASLVSLHSGGTGTGLGALGKTARGAGAVVGAGALAATMSTGRALALGSKNKDQMLGTRTVRQLASAYSEARSNREQGKTGTGNTTMAGILKQRLALAKVPPVEK